jgi:hypothetical protein
MHARMCESKRMRRCGQCLGRGDPRVLIVASYKLGVSTAY